MYRPTILLTVLVLGLAACSHDLPLAPADASDASADPPRFLIGNSPLMTLHAGDPDDVMIEVTTEVTRGLTEPKPSDLFLLRLSVSFEASGGGDLGSVGPKDVSFSLVKDEGLRGVGTVSIGACIQIPAEVFSDLQAADQGDGSANPTGSATVELVLVDGDGKEHILDTKSVSGVALDANKDG